MPRMHHPKGWKTQKPQGYIKSYDAVKNGSNRRPLEVAVHSEEQLAQLGWKPPVAEVVKTESTIPQPKEDLSLYSLRKIGNCLRCLTLGIHTRTEHGHMLCDSCFDKENGHIQSKAIDAKRKELKAFLEDKVLLPARINGDDGLSNKGTIKGATQATLEFSGPREMRHVRRNGRKVRIPGQSNFVRQQEISRDGRVAEFQIGSRVVNRHPYWEPIEDIDEQTGKPSKSIDKTIMASDSTEGQGGVIAIISYAQPVPRFKLNNQVKEQYKSCRRELRRLIENEYAIRSTSILKNLNVVASSVRASTARSDSYSSNAKVNSEQANQDIPSLAVKRTALIQNE